IVRTSPNYALLARIRSWPGCCCRQGVVRRSTAMIMSRLPGFAAMAALLGASSGCWWIVESQERDDCDRALEIVCGCPKVDCHAVPPLPIVQTLRTCDPDEIYRNRDYHLSVCILDSHIRYCAVLSALTTQDNGLCTLECTHEACDQEAACHD